MGTAPLSVYEILIIAGALVGLYIKMIIEINKLRTRLTLLEESKSDVSNLLKDVMKEIQEIKILLARKQIDQ
jgi:hypothetical protein